MILPATYDWTLVALSLLVSMVGAYAARRFSERLNAARRRAWPWLAGGSVASGASTWAMHYVGMAGLRLPVPVAYDEAMVAASYLPAALTTMLALVLVARRPLGWGAAVGGSVLMGGGIAAMHYTAMEAMRFRGMHHYSPATVAVSTVLPMLVVLAALKLTFLDGAARKASRAKDLASILLWGAANPIMHYTAMAGTSFVESHRAPDLAHTAGIGALGGLGFSLVSLLAAAAGLLTALVDRQREQGARFAERLIDAQESERRRVARELHDEIGQTLTALRLNLDAIEQAEPASIARLADDGRAIIDRALEQVRRLARDLRPPLLDDLGLAAALRSHVEREAGRAGMQPSMIADPLEGRLPAVLETACFRIAQEAVTNAIRHSGARKVEVELRRRGEVLQLTVADDGRGFHVSAPARRDSLGLLGMRERALIAGGNLEIISAPGKGTLVRARFPFPK